MEEFLRGSDISVDQTETNRRILNLSDVEGYEEFIESRSGSAADSPTSSSDDRKSRQYSSSYSPDITAGAELIDLVSHVGQLVRRVTDVVYGDNNGGSSSAFPVRNTAAGSNEQQTVSPTTLTFYLSGSGNDSSPTSTPPNPFTRWIETTGLGVAPGNNNGQGGQQQGATSLAANVLRFFERVFNPTRSENKPQVPVRFH